jgi:hypothetical protein
MSRAILAIAVLATVLAGSASAEQFYKWKDADGVTHYTSTPPPKGIDSSRVAVSGSSRSRVDQSLDTQAPASSPATPASSTTPTNDANRDERLAQGEDRTAEAIQKRRDTACETAKQRYDVLSNNAAVEWDRDGDGVAEPLDVKEHAAEMEKAQQSIGFYCKR